MRVTMSIVLLKNYGKIWPNLFSTSLCSLKKKLSKIMKRLQEDLGYNFLEKGEGNTVSWNKIKYLQFKNFLQREEIQRSADEEQN